MKIQIKQVVLAAVGVLALGASSLVTSAPLNLANVPLYLGYTVDPNVFFELDDSGSMDWEITAVNHWDACGYDAAYPNASCSISLRSDGSFYLYRWKERKLSTDIVWTLNDVSNCGANGTTVCKGTTGFQYNFTTSDNLYGLVGAVNDCSVDDSSVESCTLSLVPTTVLGAQFCFNKSATCSAPPGGNCSRTGYAAPTSGAKGYCWYADSVYSNRWNTYAKDWRVYSSDLNVTYYNPAVKYSPWPMTSLTDATFASARSNPQSGQTGYSVTRDLGGNSGVPYNSTGFVYEVWKDTNGYSGTKPNKTNVTTGSNGVVDVWDEHDRYVVTSTGVTKYHITYTVSASGLTENVGLGVAVLLDDYSRDPAAIRQNIANWYQYSRRRMLMAKGAIGGVVAGNNTFRFGLSVINMTTTTATTATTTDHTKIFVPMPSASTTDYAPQNTMMLSQLYQFQQPSKGTPLRRGLDNVGRYFSKQTVYNTVDSAGHASLSTTSFTSPITESCQQNFAVLMTDGYWNEDADPATGMGDSDGDGYVNGSGQTTTLADVARYYANHDIDTTKANNVPVLNSPTKTFQNLATFTAAFGVRGGLVDTNGDNNPDKWVDPANSTSTGTFTPSVPGKWSYSPSTKTPWNDNPTTIDDMWHAAYNSGGNFIAAKNPLDLINGLENAMNVISAQTGSSSAVAASSGAFQSDTALYLAKFNSGGWYGDLQSYLLKASGGNIVVSATPKWSASDELRTQVLSGGWSSSRKIVTFNPLLVNGSIQGKGVPFVFPANYQDAIAATFNGLNSTQVGYLLPYSISTTNAAQILVNQSQGANTLAWLRGDTSLEGSTFRTRAVKTIVNGVAKMQQMMLGDIVESNPQYVGAPKRLYPDSLEGASSAKYSDFRNGNESRTPTLYVGANDGMLHAIRASDGKETMAYVPNAVFSRLKDISSMDYTHAYTVNSTPEVNDVYYGGAWHSVLVAGLGGGGQGIYALDVTDAPSPATESSAASKVMWEFTDRNYVSAVAAGVAGSNGDPELGYTYSRPQLVRMHNGKWLAVFGNGYNSTNADGNVGTTGYAYLYFVDIQTGKLVKRIQIPVGSITTPNGLGTVTPVDLDGDYVADYIYAGDLFGNIWRVDVTASSVSSWVLGRSGNAIFTTQTGQPITTKLVVVRHPTGSGVLVEFGTGRFLEFSDADAAGKTTQSFYAVWDNIGVSGTYPVTRSQMLQQTIDSQVTHSSGALLRVTSNNSINWNTKRGWYMDLVYSGANGGEVIATDPIVRADRVIFISTLPAATVCSAGGNSWIYELDFADGSRLPMAPIDVNGDHKIDALDNAGSTPFGGMKTDNGIVTSPTILADTQKGDKEHKVFSSSNGTINEMGESVGGLQGRRSWRQLR